MTTDDPPAPPDEPPTNEPPATDRLPVDHPAAKALAKANREAEEARRRLKEIEDRDKSELQKAADALTERDKALADLPRQVRRQVLRFASSAANKGFLDPEDALAFLPDDIDMDDADAVDAALEALAQRKPPLVKLKAPPARPKPARGESVNDDDRGTKGKARAAEAFRQMHT